MRMRNHSFGTNRGFSLVELMIALAIIGIILGIAVPNYNEYLVKANRTAAKQFLLSIANKQEQYLLDNRAYAGPLTEAQIRSTLGLTAPAELSGKYTFSVNNVTANPPAYRAVATATGSQLSDRDLTIDQTGAKGGNW